MNHENSRNPKREAGVPFFSVTFHKTAPKAPSPSLPLTPIWPQFTSPTQNQNRTKPPETAQNRRIRHLKTTLDFSIPLITRRSWGSSPTPATMLCIQFGCQPPKPRCRKASGLFYTHFSQCNFNRYQTPKSPRRWDLNFNNKCLASIFTRRIAKKTFIGSAKCIYRLISYRFRNLWYGM